VTTTFANKKTIVHKGDGLQFVAMAPDVCKTPSPGGPVPIPYPNIATSGDLADGSQSVKVEGNSAALASSNLSTSTGDEAGSAGGGVSSNKIKGKVTWILYSTDVKIEGKGVVRFMDDNLHNGNMANTKGKDLGGPGNGKEPPRPTCDNCGGDSDDAYHAKLRKDLIDPKDDSAEKVRGPHGRVRSKVTNSCSKNSASGVAQDQRLESTLSPNNFAKNAKNFKFGTPIGAAKQPGERNPPGNCAEQKALYAAHQQKLFPPAPGCVVKLSVRVNRDGNDVFMIPCETCRRVLASMMCTEKPGSRKAGAGG